MGDVSPNFNEEEFVCHCGCGEVVMDYDLVYVLECVREKFKRPVCVISGTRCHDHNVRVGGKSKSRHLVGDAADIWIYGVDMDDVSRYCDELVRDNGGIGLYSTFTHVDTRGHRARWRG